jgi:hypothetical protein
LFTLVSSHSTHFTLTAVLQSSLSDLSFAVTNVYAPADHSLSLTFLAEFEALGTLFLSLGSL